MILLNLHKAPLYICIGLILTLVFDGYGQANGRIDTVQITQDCAAAEPIIVNITITNDADATAFLPLGTPIAVYAEDPLTVFTIPLGSFATTSALAPGESRVEHIAVLTDPTEVEELFIVLNDDGASGTPITFPITNIEESDYTDNIWQKITDMLFPCCLEYFAEGELDVIIIVDNSASVDFNEFSQMTNSTNRVIDQVIALGGRVAVTHYSGPIGEQLYIETDFTSDATLAKSYSRRFSGNDVLPHAIRLIDKALQGETDPNIISPQVRLNHDTAASLGVFVFTDAGVFFKDDSQLVDNPSLNNDAFKAYTDFKLKYNAVFEVVQTTSQSLEVSAAIASLGGTYFGDVTSYSDDPDGAGARPRRLTASSFELTDKEVSNIIFSLASLKREINFAYDLVIEETKIVKGFCNVLDTLKTFSFVVCSDAESTANTSDTLPVSIYHENPHLEVDISADTVFEIFVSIEPSKCDTFVVKDVLFPYDEAFVVLNDNGDNVPPTPFLDNPFFSQTGIRECNYENNLEIAQCLESDIEITKSVLFPVEEIDTNVYCISYLIHVGCVQDELCDSLSYSLNDNFSFADGIDIQSVEVTSPNFASLSGDVLFDSFDGYTHTGLIQDELIDGAESDSFLIRVCFETDPLDVILNPDKHRCASGLFDKAGLQNIAIVELEDGILFDTACIPTPSPCGSLLVGIECPKDTMLYCAQDTSINLLGVPTVNFNCCPFKNIEHRDLLLSYNCDYDYAFVREWSILDSCNNEWRCQQEVVVGDTAPALIICPSDTFLTCNRDTSIASLGEATVLNICGAKKEMRYVDRLTSFVCDYDYAFVREWSILDSCNNEWRCQQEVVVGDTAPALIICPSDTFLTCNRDTSIASLGEATVLNICGTKKEMRYVDRLTSFVCDYDYAFVREWSILDSCNNEWRCQQEVVVGDTAPALIICPSDTFLTCNRDTTTASLGEATVLNICGLGSIRTHSDEIINFLCDRNYDLIRKWQVQDSCGTEWTCDQFIMLRDLPPEIQLDLPTDTTMVNLEYLLSTLVVIDDCSVIRPDISIDSTVLQDCPREVKYDVNITANDGCSQPVIQAFSYVGEDQFVRQQFIPNAFSPNNDGVNDTWTLYTNDCLIEISNLEIFNRWGVQVYKREFLSTTSNQAELWNGQFCSEESYKDQPSETFVYRMIIKYSNGFVKPLSGEVLMLK